MLATKAALASGGITHCCLRWGLRMFFLASARSCCRWRARQCAVRRPSPRAGAGSNGRNPPGPENAWTGGIGIVFTPQHRLEPFLDQLAPGPLDSGDADVQRRGNPAVAPALARIRHVRLQENPRLRQQLRGTLTFADQFIELGTFLRAQPHYVLLDGNLFPDHESPPSLAATEIQKLPSFSMTGATRNVSGIGSLRFQWAGSDCSPVRDRAAETVAPIFYAPPRPTDPFSRA